MKARDAYLAWAETHEIASNGEAFEAGWTAREPVEQPASCQQCREDLLAKVVDFVVSLQRDVKARRAAPGRAHACRWEADEDGNWWSSCGEGFTFIDGGPVENRLRFCPYCGKRLECA